MHRISDLLDMSMVQKLADSNYQASGLPISIIDAVDATVLVKAGWSGLCTNIHRFDPMLYHRCQESDQYLDEHLGEQEYFQYRCKNGLWHIAIPIMVAKRHLATLFLSQFWFEGDVPDREYFTRQAREFDCDLEIYLKEISRIPVFTKEKVAYIVAFYRSLARFIADLAERSLHLREVEQSMQESENKYRSLVDNIPVGIYSNTPARGKFIHVNPAMIRITGCDSLEELLSIDMVDLYQNPEDRIKLLEELKVKGFIKDRELAMKKKDGTPVWCSTTVTARFNEQGEIIMTEGVVEDITVRKQNQDELHKIHRQLEMRIQERTVDLARTNEMLLQEIAERKRAEEKLREISELDPLTMIYNRRKLLELLMLEIEKVKRYARPLSLIMLDIDFFKKINDKHGHNMGDAVLKSTTSIICGNIRKIDIFARYGGDEFIILSPETDKQGAMSLADKIRDAVALHSYPAMEPVTISVGVAELSPEDSGAGLIEKADEALYLAKKRGRNRVELFTPKQRP